VTTLSSAYCTSLNNTSQLFSIYPGADIPYKFSNPNPSLNGQIGVPPIVDEILKKKQNGFFIESGAFDGEDLTNTLFFEKEKKIDTNFYL
jgi:hypothetical protein